MKPATVYSRAVRKAAEMLGRRDELARVLQVERAEIDKWILGEKKPPRELFLRVVDLLIADPDGSDAGPPRRARSRKFDTHKVRTAT